MNQDDKQRVLDYFFEHGFIPVGSEVSEYSDADILRMLSFLRGGMDLRRDDGRFMMDLLAGTK
jgi:hypothetical protein